jgi:hypothetical protein
MNRNQEEEKQVNGKRQKERAVDRNTNGERGRKK